MSLITKKNLLNKKVILPLGVEEFVLVDPNCQYDETIVLHEFNDWLEDFASRGNFDLVEALENVELKEFKYDRLFYTIVSSRTHSAIDSVSDKQWKYIEESDLSNVEKIYFILANNHIKIRSMKTVDPLIHQFFVFLNEIAFPTPEDFLFIFRLYDGYFGENTDCFFNSFFNNKKRVQDSLSHPAVFYFMNRAMKYITHCKDNTVFNEFVEKESMDYDAAIPFYVSMQPHLFAHSASWGVEEFAGKEKLIDYISNFDFKTFTEFMCGGFGIQQYSSEDFILAAVKNYRENHDKIKISYSDSRRFAHNKFGIEGFDDVTDFDNTHFFLKFIQETLHTFENEEEAKDFYYFCLRFRYYKGDYKKNINHVIGLLQNKGFAPSEIYELLQIERNSGDIFSNNKWEKIINKYNADDKIPISWLVNLS